jgi:hypothetical protein
VLVSRWSDTPALGASPSTPAEIEQHGQLLARRPHEPDPGAPESPVAAIGHHQAVDIDLGARSRQIEGQGHRRLGQHGQVTRSSQRDAARPYVFGLSQVKTIADRAANRAHGSYPPSGATISFGPTALYVHVAML